MSIDNEDEMQGSEFALTAEEQAELDAEEKADELAVQGGDNTPNLSAEEIDALINNIPGKTEQPVKEKTDDVPTGGDTSNSGTGGNVEQTTTSEQHEQVVIPDFQGKFEKYKADHDAALEKQTEILDQIGDLGKELDGGGLGHGEYNAKLKRLELNLKNIESDILQTSQGMSDVQSEYNSYVDQQNKETGKVWQQHLNQFVADNPVYGTDQQYQTAFDETLFDLQEKGALAGFTHPQIISTVQHYVELKLGKPQVAQAPEQKKQVPKRENVQIPTGVSNMQTLESNETNDEFAHIDRLNGMEYEAAVDKLQQSNPEAFKRYMAG